MDNNIMEETLRLLKKYRYVTLNQLADLLGIKRKEILELTIGALLSQGLIKRVEIKSQCNACPLHRVCNSTKCSLVIYRLTKEGSEVYRHF